VGKVPRNKIFKRILRQHLQSYAEVYDQCPANCNKINGIDCTDRDFTKCNFFQDLLRKQLNSNMILLRRHMEKTGEGLTPHHYLFEWRPCFHWRRWYQINEKNIYPNRRDVDSLNDYRSFMSRVWQGEEVAFYKHDYDTETKRLTIDPLEV